MSTKILGGNQTTESGVTNGSFWTTLKDRLGNTLTKMRREQVTYTQEYLPVGVKNDDAVLGLRGDRKGNMVFGNYIPEIIENFEGATINVQKWTAINSLFAPAQATISGYNMNNTNLMTINAYAILMSQRYMYKYPRVPIQFRTRVRANIPTNSTFDTGWGVPTTTTLIVANGCCLRCIAGVWSLVTTFNGSETNNVPVLSMDGATQFSTSSTNSEYYVIDIIADDDNIVATIQDSSTGNFVGKAILQIPLSVLCMWGATSLPIYTRLYNNGTPATVPIVAIAELQALATDIYINMDANQIAANTGLTAGRNPFTGAQLENHTNSTAPVSATLSNTLSGYATMGGRFQFAAVAGAATDYCLFGVQIPPNSKFLCEGIHIELYNTVTAVATTPTIFEWSMGFNSSAVSLATANIIRRQIGCQNLQVGAGVGACASPLDVIFMVGEVVESSRYLQVILNMPVGTATATEIFRGTVLIKGRFI